MTPWRVLGVATAVVLLAGFALATASAAENRPAVGPLRAITPTLSTSSGTPVATPIPPLALVAIAIGELHEANGDVATVDLHAAIKDGQTGGNLRFYSADDGYYNGGVNHLVVENGVIHATGGGGLLQSSGQRVNVVFVAEITIATKHATIHVHGSGVDYTLDGVINPGLVMGGPPPA